ncbi:hypothetical protein KW506_03520 [Vibrio fluvialis]|nr:hypothetical protein [Vibrio fluvialis]
MSRQYEQEFIPVMFVLVVLVFASFSFSLAKFFGAPWNITFYFMLKSLFITIIYCIYAWIRYHLLGNEFQTNYGYYGYTKSWYHYIRIWPIAIVLIFIVSFEMLDHSGTVTYSGFFAKAKTPLRYYDADKAWYTFWYSKLLISCLILVGGNLVHHTLAKWFRSVFD